MTHHTPEPWATDYRERHDGMFAQEVFDANGETIATLAWFPVDSGVGTTTNREANARRIVACVNACAGVSNGELAMTTMSVVLARMNEAEQQRDELLAALHDAATSLETIQLRSFGEDSFLDSKPEMRSYAGSRAAVAREAIAKAKDGKDINKTTGETK